MGLFPLCSSWNRNNLARRLECLIILLSRYLRLVQSAATDRVNRYIIFPYRNIIHQIYINGHCLFTGLTLYVTSDTVSPLPFPGLLVNYQSVLFPFISCFGFRFFMAPRSRYRPQRSFVLRVTYGQSAYCTHLDVRKSAEGRCRLTVRFYKTFTEV